MIPAAVPDAAMTLPIPARRDYDDAVDDASYDYAYCGRSTSLAATPAANSLPTVAIVATLLPLLRLPRPRWWHLLLWRLYAHTTTHHSMPFTPWYALYPIVCPVRAHSMPACTDTGHKGYARCQNYA